MADKALQTAFEASAKDGKLSSDCIKKWFNKAAIIGKETGITEADVENAFTKTSKDKKSLDFAGLKECVNTLAKEKKAEPKQLMEKLAAAGAQGGKQTGAGAGAQGGKQTGAGAGAQGGKQTGADAGAKFSKGEKGK